MISLLTANAGLPVARISMASSQGKLFRNRISRFLFLEQFQSWCIQQARVERAFRLAFASATYFASAAEVIDLSGGSGFLFYPGRRPKGLLYPDTPTSE